MYILFLKSLHDFAFLVLILKNVETIKSYICNKLTQVSQVSDCTVEAHCPYS